MDSVSPVVVMTGATNGIGRLAAIELARQGAHLVLIARSQSKADATRDVIRATTPEARIDCHVADLASLDQVSRVGEQIAAQYERIHVLINNAGLHAFEPRTTVDGYAEMVAVNYLAPWLLTNVLCDRLIGSAPSRIVPTASEASRNAGPLCVSDDLFKTVPFSWLGSSRLYGRTKLLDIMFSLELARQLEGTGVAVNCLDPGFNVTGLGRELRFAAPLERLLTRLKIGDPSRGAAIIVRLATDPELASSRGYFSVKAAKPLNPAAPADDAKARRDLWAITARAIAKQIGTDRVQWALGGTG
jgi:NAD(P)-dependent dehydrogenase (short-subunit alcohol dehydrogenase family)